MTTFKQSLQKLPIQHINRKIYIYDWEYYPKTIKGLNKKTGEVFVGSFHELLIEKLIWNSELLIP